MPARATITVVSAVVDMGLPTEATVTSNYIEVDIVAYIDTSSDNQWVYDTIPLGDVQFRSVEKNLTDTTTLADEDYLTFSKNNPETLTILENFVRTVVYERSFTDAFTLDDFTGINKDFYGNKGNIFGISDEIGLTTNKVFNEALTMGDAIVLLTTFFRALPDSITLSEEFSNLLNKVESDSFSFSSVANKNFNSGASSSLSIGDSLARQFSKELSPYTGVLNSGSLNTNRLNPVSLPDIRITITDRLSIEPNKIFSESFSFSDSNIFAISKNISDGFTLDDSYLINKNFYGNKGNIFSMTEVLTYSLTKDETDLFSFSDSSSVSYNKNYSVDSFSVSDSSILAPNKSIGDSFSFSEELDRQIEKTISDSFGLDDSSQVNKAFHGNKGNLVNITDLVVVNLIQPSTLGSNVLNARSLN
jgi:hypothetical protein